MKRSWLTVALILGLLHPAQAQVACERVSKPISLDASGEACLPKDDNGFKLHLKGRLETAEVNIFWRQTGDDDQRSIVVHAEVDNTSPDKAFWGFYAAFFDNRGTLLACGGASPSEGINAPTLGKTDLIIPIPRTEITRVASYQLLFYTAPKAIGTQ